ncbi:hypothetical protein J5N97_011440 [Dioscorea zingiberensis]|uniref:Uncharacterized protein n=1 Tax=Dioscorea zingiberensis TaxID=325984 RepID=A0A9D5D334_9LILI|nr:hypothetical protein J5N97_011440 [Dioscorea zingiberensis]
MEGMEMMEPDENDLQKLLEEDLDGKTGSDNGEFGSGDEQNQKRQTKKKRYHRHTQRQIQEMEAFFKECPHPDDKQRKELSRALGLEPLQVKFWFQNKRTQIKAHNERFENSHLRAENERLSSENALLKEALKNALCLNCGGAVALGELSFEGNDLRVENAKLREEIERISSIAAKYAGKPMNPHQHSPPMIPCSAVDVGMGVYHVSQEINGEMVQVAGIGKPVIIELAVAAMDELIGMAQLGGLGAKLAGFKTEATRETAVVAMNAENIIEMLMNGGRWVDFFPSIISRGATLDVFSSGAAGNFNGALLVMSGSFQMATPLVPSRESLFIRYCKQHAEKTWAVVDVSIDGLRPDTSLTYRRRPSGCLIQEMAEGFSKVIWVEHMEVDDTNVADIYKPLVNSGLAFGAQRWVSSLQRQCHRLASATADVPLDEIGALTSILTRKNWMKLSERMVRCFANGVSATDQWSLVAGTGVENDVRVTTRKGMNEPGSHLGIVLNATTAVWLQAPVRRVFEFLHSETARCEWDILSNDGVIEEVSQVADGGSLGNCISLLRVKNEILLGSGMTVLQESSIDASGAYVIYAPLDDTAMDLMLNSSEPDFVALLPAGFAVLPDGPSGLLNGGMNAAGSLLTVSFQILLSASPSERIPLSSITTVNSLITRTVDRIKSVVSSEET